MKTIVSKLLEGNVGSNILGTALVAVIGAHIDTVKVLAGDKGEIAKAAVAAAAGVFAYSVGKK